jgi:acyl carrier protein
MSNADTIASVLIDYLQSSQGMARSMNAETDLVESGMLDSMLVMDLICFLEARFQVSMEPADINPQNLRSVTCLAHYLQARLSCDADAA